MTTVLNTIKNAILTELQTNPLSFHHTLRIFSTSRESVAGRFEPRKKYYYFPLNTGCLIEGSLNSKLPTIWRVEKQMKSR